MTKTPFFPAWRCSLAPMRQSLAKTFHQIHACTLSQLENRFGSCLPSALFPKPSKGPNSRHRIYTQCRTFWCFLWQCLQVNAAGREVVCQLQALLALRGATPISSQDGAYCVARQRLPESLFVAALQATAAACQRTAISLSGFLHNRPVKLI